MSLGFSHLNYEVSAWRKRIFTLCNKTQAAQVLIVKTIYCRSDFLNYFIHKLMKFDETYKCFSLLKLFKETKYPTANQSFLTALVGCKQKGHIQLGFHSLIF